MTSVMKFIFACLLCALLTFVACVESAQAQGSRKDDIVFNAQGRPMAGAGVRVCTATATGQPCTPLASIYSDPGLTQALANPTATDGLGNYNFYAAPGRYMLEISGPGITTKQMPNVILPSDPSTPTFTSVTSTSGISAFSLSLSGNLTVSGSAAVSGALTVGGLPVPTANQDNQWTSNQRFGGPIPWRDMTKYMPAGGCSSTIPQIDPQTTGTISSGSSSLMLANARDFKNGCGIAVLNAGPTSSLTGPIQGCAISSISRSSNIVTVTCASGHNIPTGVWDHSQGIQITGVTDSSFNGTYDVTGVADATHFTYGQSGANASSSGGAATMQFGYAHGAAGSTTYNYKVAAVDGNGGMSAASAAFTIANGNATLSTINYNWINFGIGSVVDPRNQPQVVPHEWVIYSDKGLGGGYFCVGASFTNAYTDFGLPMPCPAFAPATPPVTATAQVLNTTISAGGGTTTLTLAASASNSATTQNVYHDESSFLNACIADDQNDRGVIGFPSDVGSYGCYVPAGNYYLNGPLLTDAGGASGTGGDIWVAGSLFFNVFPWYFSTNSWYVKGFGGSSYTASFGHAATTALHVSPTLAAGVVMRSVNNATFSGMGISNPHGHGIWVGNVAYLGAPASFRFDDDEIGMASGAAGAALVFDQNVIGVWVNNSALIGTPSSPGLSSIWITGTSWNSFNNCCMYFNNISTANRGVRIDAPGGGIGSGSYYFTNWINEALTATDTGLIIHDNGPNAPGISSTTPLLNISVHNLNNADPQNGPGAYGLFQELGTSLGISSVDLNEVNSFGSLLTCGPNTTVCNNRPSLATTATSSSSLGGTLGGSLLVAGNAIYAEMPIHSKLGYSSYGATPLNAAWVQELPPPDTFTINGTAAGSLPAATYCMAVEGKDAQPTPGLTLPSNMLCQTVGASAAINLQWQGVSGENQMFSGFRFFYCSTGGSSCTPNNYFDVATGGNPITYSFTTTAGSTAGILNTSTSAYLSWLYWDRSSKSCLLCTSAAGSGLWQLGVGEPNPGVGVKLAVSGGTLQGEGGIQAGADVAFNASPRGLYNAFLPNLTSPAVTYQRMTLDKGITVTRLQLALGTAGAGCTTQAIVSVTDGSSSITLTTVNGTAIYDSGAVSQNYAAAANLDVKIATPASGCTTAPQNANVSVQYRMQ